MTSIRNQYNILRIQYQHCVLHKSYNNVRSVMNGIKTGEDMMVTTELALTIDH